MEKYHCRVIKEKRNRISMSWNCLQNILVSYLKLSLILDQYPPITTLGHSRGTGKHAHPDSKSSLILDYYWNVAQSFKERQS